MIDHLSSSQIKLYLQCGLKYRFQYVDLLPRTFRSSALAFGSALHSTLAWFHKQRMKGSQVTLDQLYKLFDTDWYSQTVETDVRYKDGEEEMKLVILGKEFLGYYFQGEHRPLKGAEVPFTVPLVHPSNGKSLGINLEGFFDLVEADDTIVEFKTSAHMMNASEVNAHLQLSAYGYAFQRLYGRPPSRFRVVNFVKNKKPRVESIETARSKADYEAFFFLTERVLKGIQQGVFFPNPGFFCKDCEYADLCPMWKGQKNGQGEKVEVPTTGGRHDRTGL